MVRVGLSSAAAGAARARTAANARMAERSMPVPSSVAAMRLKRSANGEGRRSALAISIFLRQHDLVQVQWVFLSSVSGAPQRDDRDLIRVCLPCKSAPTPILPFDGLLVIVGGGAVDHDLLRELYVERRRIWWAPMAAPTRSSRRGPDARGDRRRLRFAQQSRRLAGADAADADRRAGHHGFREGALFDAGAGDGGAWG